MSASTHARTENIIIRDRRWCVVHVILLLLRRSVLGDAGQVKAGSHGLHLELGVARK